MYPSLMTAPDVLQRLESLGDEKMRRINQRHGAGENHFGVKMADLRAIAKEIKTDHALGLELWATGNLEARFVATLIMRPKELSDEQLESIVRDATYGHLADWVNTNLVKQHPNREALRQRWLTSDEPMLGRSAWSLTADRIAKNPEGLDLSAMLDRIEREMVDTPESARWTMNFCLANIGIHHPELRSRALEIGERLGVYRDYPTPKGCTSPFAPIWINAMVERSKP